MLIADFIEKVRNRPEIERRRILVGTTFSITALVFFFWLSVMLYGAGGGPTTASVSDLNKDKGPISEIADIIGNFVGTAGQKISNFKNSINLSSEDGSKIEEKSN